MAETDEIAYLSRRAAEERERAARTAGAAAVAHAALADAHERRVATTGETFLFPRERVRRGSDAAGA